MCPRTEKLRIFLLGLGLGLLLSFVICAWVWKLLLAAGLIAIALLMDSGQISAGRPAASNS